jgi:hypothetical protein
MVTGIALASVADTTGRPIGTARLHILQAFWTFLGPLFGPGSVRMNAAEAHLVRLQKPHKRKKRIEPDQVSHDFGVASPAHASPDDDDDDTTAGDRVAMDTSDSPGVLPASSPTHSAVVMQPPAIRWANIPGEKEKRDLLVSFTTSADGS